MATTIASSQRTAAKVAGWSCPLTMVIAVLANYGLLNPLIVRGNAAATAQNIMTHETQFRTAATMSGLDRKSTRLNSSHSQISYAVFCLKKKKKKKKIIKHQ